MSSRNAWRCPTTTTRTSLWRKRESDYLSRLTEARLGSGLDKAPSPAWAGAQDTGADTPTLRILEWVQTGSGAHRRCRRKPLPGQTRGCSVPRTPAERTLRATVAGT